MPDYFISGPQNFEQLVTGTRGFTNDRSGIAPLGPIPQVLGVQPLGAPLTERKQGVKASLPWRLLKLGAPDAWAGANWEQAPPDIASFATEGQIRGWRHKVGGCVGVWVCVCVCL